MTHWKRETDFTTFEGRALWQLGYSYRRYLNAMTDRHEAVLAQRWSLADLCRQDARTASREVQVLVDVLCGRGRPHIVAKASAA